MSTFKRRLLLGIIPPLVWTISLLIAEVVFRLLGVPVSGTIQGAYQTFGDHSYRLQPGVSLLQTWASGPFTVRTDTLGLRVGAQAHGATEVGGRADILVLGDSQTFGEGLDEEQTVVGNLRTLAEGAGLKLANAGVGGHLLKNQSELARWLVKEQRLDIGAILVLVTPRSAAMASGSGQVVVVNGNLYDRPPGAAQLLREWLSRHSAAWIIVRDATRGEAKAAPGQGFLDFYRAGLALDQRSADLAAWVEELRAKLLPARPRIVLGYMPPDAESRVDETVTTSGQPPSEFSEGAPRECTRRAAMKAGVLFVDLSGALEACRAAGERVTLHGDHHYGPEASRRVAELAWESVDWKNLVREGRQVEEPPHADP